MDEQTLSDQINDLKTDENELQEVLEHYDLDEQLEQEFALIDEQFKQLEIKYQSLLNTRRFLHGSQS